MESPSEIVGNITESNVLKDDHEIGYPVPNCGKMLTLFLICNVRHHYKELLN